MWASSCSVGASQTTSKVAPSGLFQLCLLSGGYTTSLALRVFTEVVAVAAGYDKNRLVAGMAMGRGLNPG